MFELDPRSGRQCSSETNSVTCLLDSALQRVYALHSIQFLYSDVYKTNRICLCFQMFPLLHFKTVNRNVNEAIGDSNMAEEAV